MKIEVVTWKVLQWVVMWEKKLCDEVGGVDGTAVGTADGVEDGVRRGVVGIIEGGGGLVLGTGDGLLGDNNVNTV